MVLPDPGRPTGKIIIATAAAIDAYVSLLTSEAQADTGGDAA
jgi:hypothetical protein